MLAIILGSTENISITPESPVEPYLSRHYDSKWECKSKSNIVLTLKESSRNQAIVTKQISPPKILESSLFIDNIDYLFLKDQRI